MIKSSTQFFYRHLLLKTTASLMIVSSMGCSTSINVSAPKHRFTNKSQKSNSVRIYPDVLKKTMHVIAYEKNPIDFFVFDIEGTLMVHYKMNNGDHKRITGLDKGGYIYQVFKNDEMSESGKLIIK